MRDGERLYEFGGFRLDPARRLLFGPDGRTVPLKPKVLDTLICLVEHSGELLDKRTLMEAVWGDVIVEDNSLSQHISTLRHVFGEAPGENRFIVTVPGRGFRFVAAVRTQTRAGAEAHPISTADASPRSAAGGTDSIARASRPAYERTSRRFYLAILIVLAVGIALFGVNRFALDPVRDDRSIVVLPFEDLSETDMKWFSRGVSEELFSLLADVPGLRTVHMASDFSLDAQGLTIAELADVLDVSYVLRGSVRRDGARFRITAQLLDERGTPVFALPPYDREIDDLFTTQNEIATSVVERLRIELLEPVPVLDQPDDETLTLYRQAQQINHLALFGSLPEAIDMSQRAIARDGDFLAVRVELFKSYGLAAVAARDNGDTQQYLEFWKGLAQTAEEAAKEWPDDPQVAGMLGNTFMRGEDGGPSTVDRMRTAARYLQAAVDGDPNALIVLFPAAVFAFELDHLELAERLHDRLVDRHPTCAACRVSAMGIHNWLGRYDRTIETHEKARTLGLFSEGLVQSMALLEYGRALFSAGYAEAALAELEKVPRGERYELRRQVLMTMTLSAVPGREADFDAMFASLMASLPRDSANTVVGEIHAWTGKIDSAYEALSDVSALPSYFRYGWYADRLSKDPRWSRLTAKIRRDYADIQFDVDLPD